MPDVGSIVVVFQSSLVIRRRFTSVVSLLKLGPNLRLEFRREIRSKWSVTPVSQPPAGLVTAREF
jgi:hypothetical protein